jgi:hypothetical protein
MLLLVVLVLQAMGIVWIVGNGRGRDAPAVRSVLGVLFSLFEGVVGESWVVRMMSTRFGTERRRIVDAGGPEAFGFWVLVRMHAAHIERWSSLGTERRCLIDHTLLGARIRGRTAATMRSRAIGA